MTSDLALEGGLAGNVSSKFEDKGPMTFLSLALEEQLIKAAAAAKAKAI